MQTTTYAAATGRGRTMALAALAALALGGWQAQQAQATSGEATAVTAGAGSATVVIRKVTDPAVGSPAFTFSSGGTGGQALPAAATFVLAGGESLSRQVDAGTSYAISEDQAVDAEHGYTLAAVGGDGCSVVGARVVVTPQAGETVTCTFVSERDRPSLSVEAAGPASASPGDELPFAYTAENTGNVPLHDVVVSDDACAPVVGPADGAGQDGGLLLPGERWTFACSSEAPSGAATPRAPSRRPRTTRTARRSRRPAATPRRSPRPAGRRLRAGTEVAPEVAHPPQTVRGAPCRTRAGRAATRTCTAPPAAPCGRPGSRARPPDRPGRVPPRRAPRGDRPPRRSPRPLERPGRPGRPASRRPPPDGDRDVHRRRRRAHSHPQVELQPMPGVLRAPGRHRLRNADAGRCPLLRRMRARSGVGTSSGRARGREACRPCRRPPGARARAGAGRRSRRSSASRSASASPSRNGPSCRSGGRGRRRRRGPGSRRR